MNLELLPDQPARDNPGLLQAKNVIPYAGAFRPVRNFIADTNALDSACLGAAVLINAAGAVYNYAGDATKVYTRSGNTYSSCSTGHTAVLWEFSRYYDTVVAVNGSEKPMTGNFAGALTPVTAAPAGARAITVARNYTIVGNDATDAAAVTWSALGDPTNWTTGETGAQHLDGAGKVTKLVGGEYVTVLCQRGIYRMTYLGASPYWQFDLIEQERGALYQGMVANVGHLIYYLDGAGFFVFDGSQSRPISSEKITTTFFDDFDRDAASLCSAVADTDNNLIIFAYPGSGHGATANRQIVYNYVENRWAFPIERNVERLVYSLSSATFSDSIATACDLDDTPCDDASFLGSDDPSVAAFTSDHKHSKATGSVLDATIESGETSFDPTNKAFVLGVRPIVDGVSSGIQAAVDSRNLPGATVSRGTLTSANSRTGIVYQRSYARYHRFRMQVTSDFESIIGFEPILREGPR